MGNKRIETCGECEHFSWSCFYADYICRLDLNIDVSPYDISKECPIKKERNMTKDKLKNGMVVETRNGNRYIVINDKFVRKNGWITFDGYKSDLVCTSDGALDIVKVFMPHSADLIVTFLKEYDYGLCWTRTEPKKVTMAEVEEKFGCKVEIVREKNDKQ